MQHSHQWVLILLEKELTSRCKLSLDYCISPTLPTRFLVLQISSGTMRRQSISSPPFLLETFSSTTSAKVPSTPSRKPLKGYTESKTPSKRSIIPTTHLRIHLPSQDLGPHRLQEFRSLHSLFLPEKYRQAPRPFSWIPPLWLNFLGASCSRIYSSFVELCSSFVTSTAFRLDLLRMLRRVLVILQD